MVRVVWRMLDFRYQFRAIGCIALGVALHGLFSGCNRNAYLASQPGVPGAFAANQQQLAQQQAMLQQQTALAPQLAELERKVRLLDDNNRQLTTQLAQSQQMYQLTKERSDLLARQLQDVSGQLEQSRIAQNQSTQKIQGLQASIQSRGSAVLTANSSLSRQMESLKAMGIPAQQDGDIVRMSIPADQLFNPGTIQLTSSADSILDKAAAAIAKVFPRQRVAIEGHTDNASVQGAGYQNAYQLSSAQSQVVLDTLMRRHGIPTGQLFSVAHGPNHPISDNQTPLGRAQNRRIDIVVYPDSF